MASEQVAAASSHFTAGRLLAAGRPERETRAAAAAASEPKSAMTKQQHVPQHTNGMRWRRVAPAARENSHEPSGASGSSSCATSDAELDAGAEQDCALGSAATAAAAARGAHNKPSVGPMGIFFKVWSLVKVTKARHNKMKRQHSEDAGPFHFVAGERLAHGALPAAAHAQHLLQDGHFRRAGSQPPPASHLAIGYGGGGGARAALDVQGPSLQASAGAAPTAGATTTGTNGSSSGVSSTTSSTLATNAYGGGGDPAPGPEATAGGGAVRGQRGQSTASARSWASRMRRPRAPQDVGMGGAAPASSARQRARRSGDASEKAAPDERPSARARLSLLRLQPDLRKPPAHSSRRSSVASDEDAEWAGAWRRDPVAPRTQNEEEQEEEEEEERRTLGDESERADDSDPNDIYSTPNDSIQSVPSGGRLPDGGGSGPGGGASASARQQQQQHYPARQMTKSLSTSNFGNQLSKQQQQPGQPPGPSFNRIDENQVLGSEARLAGRVISDRDEFADPKLAPNLGRQHGPSRVRTSAGGSRFFISSSSSEDSSTPHPQQQQQQAHVTAASQRTPAHSLTGAPQQVSLGVGLHYHAPPPPPPADVARPTSLLIPAGQQLARQPTASLMTPSALLMGALGGPTASVAAMSPVTGAHQDLFAVQQQQLANGWALASGPGQSSCQVVGAPASYKRSPSLFEMPTGSPGPNALVSRFSARHPSAQRAGPQAPVSSFVRPVGGSEAAPRALQRLQLQGARRRAPGVPHSVSLHDCKLTSAPVAAPAHERPSARGPDPKASEYKLAQMLLELGKTSGRAHSSPSGGVTPRDADGHTALMHAVISENLSALKCLIEHGVDLDATNNEGLSALDLVCARPAEFAGSPALEMLRLLIESGADLDRARPADGSRLLDRLIGEHGAGSTADDKLAYIDLLLHNGAKLGSATWAAAAGKQEVQLRLLRKLCQDGYFLYKKAAIEAAVYRFEYALRRIQSLEQQLNERQRAGARNGMKHQLAGWQNADQLAEARADVQQVKYQTFLGLSRCERKRRFFKRALEFAHMAILVDSTAYEGYYSKAHILKDLGQLDDALLTIDQADRLVTKSADAARAQLCDLKSQQEAIVFDGCFQVHDPARARWLEAGRAELDSTLDYLLEARKYVAWLRAEILDDKRRAKADADQDLGGRA